MLEARQAEARQGSARAAGAGRGAVSRRVETVRLLQGLVVAYEHMGADQRRAAALKHRAFVPAIAPLLEVTPPPSPPHFFLIQTP